MNNNVYFYWGGNAPVSFLRYLSIVSFKQYNPDFKIHLYLSSNTQKEINWTTEEHSEKYTGKDYLEECKKISDVVEKFDMNLIGFSNELSEVHKSDIIRNWLLYSNGGIWSDMDILFFKSLPEDLKNVDFMAQEPILKYYTTSFSGGVKNSQFYKIFLEKQRQVKLERGYQKYATDLLGTSTYHGLKILDMKSVYYFNSFRINDIFNSQEDMPEESFGIHWYAGSKLTREWENKINPHNYKNFSNAIGKKLGEIKYE